MSESGKEKDTQDTQKSVNSEISDISEKISDLQISQNSRNSLTSSKVKEEEEKENEWIGQKSELLDVLSEVKSKIQDKLGIVDFPLPQFCLVGKQSVGKSRLIEALAGEQFNFVSSSLGSRRPTVLEFRNVQSHLESRWYLMDKNSSHWQLLPIHEVFRQIAELHECLGTNVSEEAIYVRVESRDCVDMCLIDLPGFREFALDTEKQLLADRIENLVTSFMKDSRNVLLCVEEAGDAANLATLTRCKRIDPHFQRTILIRNKLDKYYRDLTSQNVNEWLSGFGDLPAGLVSFVLTLPHWKDNELCPKSFVQLRSEFNREDVETMKANGISSKFSKYIGFNNFSTFLEHRIEQMFSKAIVPVLQRLKELRIATNEQMREMEEEIEKTNPEILLTTVRDVGMSFSHALQHVMEGYVRAEINRVSLEEELHGFHEYHSRRESSVGMTLLPSDDVACLEDYIDYLKNDIKVPMFEAEICGGAQFRRLMYEIEVFLRFAEIGSETKKKDVIQARGVSMSTLTWRDVVVKLLSNEAHLPMKQRVRYAGERIRWFFLQQKACIIDFMQGIRGSPDEQMYSALYSKNVRLMIENDAIKQLVYETYDLAVDRQLESFYELFSNTLASTFSNPWVFLKRTTLPSLTVNEERDVCLPSFEDTKSRIPREIEDRSGIEHDLSRWIDKIPCESSRVDDSVDQVQIIVLKTFAYIRNQIADQVELFADSFFKLPMMRRLEEDMMTITLSEGNREAYLGRRDYLQEEHAYLLENLRSIEHCQNRLQKFALKCSSRKQ